MKTQRRTHLLEVCEGAGLALHERAHAAERGALELLAAVERVTVLEEADIVLGDAVEGRKRIRLECAFFSSSSSSSSSSSYSSLRTKLTLVPV